MTKLFLALALPLALAACAEDRLTPAPGEHPDWPQPGAPRPAHAPLPFTTNYAPHAGSTIASPPMDGNGNIPFAVRGHTAPAAADWREPQPPLPADPHPGTQ